MDTVDRYMSCVFSFRVATAGRLPLPGLIGADPVAGADDADVSVSLALLT